MKPILKKHLSSFQIIISGFAVAVLLGTLLLMLPIASATGAITPITKAMFTAVSAVCVTGLVVFDTATYWSQFGQAVILILIQIGGLGVVTLAVAVAMISGRKIGLMQRSTMQEAIAAPKVSGMVRLTRFILTTTFIIEIIGALCMMPVFCRDFGAKGIWLSIFHSISAFCNAGFDLMGTKTPFSSLVSYKAQSNINIIIMLLITVGGIGFLVWDDIRINKFRFSKYRLQSKLVLLTSLLLVLLPFAYFYFFEFGKIRGNEKVLVALFQAVTPRTAGFNTVDLATLSDKGKVITIILMLIGGSTGSTAGGMKTTTVAILIFSAISVFRRKEDTECFGRRVSDETVKNAAAILLLYLILFMFGGIAISMLENLPLGDCLFETASAIGTVGLTLGLTPSLGEISRLILMLLMFFGRVGGLTLIFAAMSDLPRKTSRNPQEKITVG